MIVTLQGLHPEGAAKALQESESDAGSEDEEPAISTYTVAASGPVAGVEVLSLPGEEGARFPN